MDNRKMILKDVYIRIIQYGCSLLPAIQHNDWEVVDVMVKDLDTFDTSSPDRCIVESERRGRSDIARKLIRDVPMDVAHVYRCIELLPGSTNTDVLQSRLQEEIERMTKSDEDESPSWCSIL